MHATWHFTVIAPTNSFRTDLHDTFIVDILTSIFLSKWTSSVSCSAGHEAIKNTIASTLGLNFLISPCVVQCYVSKYPCSYSNECSHKQRRLWSVTVLKKQFSHSDSVMIAFPIEKLKTVADVQQLIQWIVLNSVLVILIQC